MKVLLVHCRYQQRAGEDAAFDAERELLRKKGLAVVEHVVDNRDIPAMGRARLAVETIWSRRTRAALARLLAKHEPDVAHFHNTFPLVSPSGYAACRSAGVPVVQTLQNFRLLCPAATMFRDGRPCEECATVALSWQGIAHGCYRSSRLQTGVVAAMLAAHRLLGTWRDAVDVYLAMSRFARDTLVAAGLPADRVMVQPNMLTSDPGEGSHGGDFALFVGRLTPEKGVPTLLAAWHHLARPMPLRIVGDGLVRSDVQAAVASSDGAIELLGWRERAEVLALMREAKVLIFPSEWYEGCPVTILEAFATGLPVVASDLGGTRELVEDGRTGWHFRAGDPADLARAVETARRDDSERARRGAEARRDFETRFTADAHFDGLMRVYAAAARAAALAHLPRGHRT